MSHGALLGAVPGVIRSGFLALVLAAIGWRIAGRRGGIVSFALAIATPIAMAAQHTPDGKATAAEWCLGAGIAGMLLCDIFPGKDVPHDHPSRTRKARR